MVRTLHTVCALCALLLAAGPAAAQSRAASLLRPLPPIEAARILNAPGVSPLRFAAPAALAAHQGWLFLADRASARILRYDPAQAALAALAEFSGTAAIVLAAGPDLSLYVADSGRRNVRQYAWDGRLQREFADERLLARPVAVLPGVGGELVVADGLYKHLVHFNAFGRAVRTTSVPGLDSISAAASGPQGAALLDRAAGRIVLLGSDGSMAEVEDSDMLRDPFALAFDRYGRLFVADAFNGSLVMFVRDAPPLVLQAGQLGVIAVSAIAIDRDLLYVADSVGSRIAVFQLAAPAAGAAGGKHD